MGKLFVPALTAREEHLAAESEASNMPSSSFFGAQPHRGVLTGGRDSHTLFQTAQLFRRQGSRVGNSAISP